MWKASPQRFFWAATILASSVFCARSWGPAPRARLSVNQEETLTGAPRQARSPWRLRTCDGQRPQGELWLVLSSAHCPPCRTLLRDLAQHQRQLEERGITVVHALVNGQNCAQALFETRRFGPWPVWVASRAFLQTQGFQQTPTILFIQKGRLVARVTGQVPVPLLLQEKWMQS